MPLIWKLAKISPLFKGGDKFDAKNYRPVAVLPAMSKVIEKIVFGRLKKHVETYNLLADTQNAYREKRSVTTSMLQLYDEILQKQEDGVDSACVFLDCSAAFDTIQHHVLLGKLKLYGVSEKGLAFMKDYLSERAQYVSIGGNVSDIRKVIDGTFQGSIGGPWCFLIIINDIVILGKAGNFTIYIYADDNCLRIDLSGDIEADQKKLDEIMKDVVKYMNSQKLKFNFKKTEFVVASPKNHEKYSNLVLNFDGSVVKQQKHARLLGLQVSWDLTHKWYVSEMKNSLIASLNQRLFILNKLKNKCPKKCLKNFAHGLIYSKAAFGVQYWSRPLPAELWKQIELVLNKAARIVLKIRPLQMHVLDTYRVLGWMPANAMRDFHDLNLFWSIKHYKKPKNLSEKFKSEQESQTMERMVTRSVSQNAIRRTQENDSRLPIRAESFVPRMVRKFNDMGPEWSTLPQIPNASDDERFQVMKCKLRNFCTWEYLGLPGTWPENAESAMLDRENELFGLGLNSDTSSDEMDDDEPAG